jgi:hypothetical protein
MARCFSGLLFLAATARTSPLWRSALASDCPLFPREAGRETTYTDCFTELLNSEGRCRATEDRDEKGHCYNFLVGFNSKL